MNSTSATGFCAGKSRLRVRDRRHTVLAHPSLHLRHRFGDKVSGDTQMTMFQKLMSVVAAAALLLPFGAAMMTQAAQIVA